MQSIMCQNELLLFWLEQLEENKATLIRDNKVLRNRQQNGIDNTNTELRRIQKNKEEEQIQKGKE